MIKDDKQLKQTREQLAHLEEDLISLQREIYPVNPDRFHLMAEAYIDHIMELRKQVGIFFKKRSVYGKGIYYRD